MYVCICNTITDRDIREAIDRGASSLFDVQSHLPVAGCCGRCEETARQVVDECLIAAGRHASG
ncbi:MAG TPA: (2Fe-2S)-binding protein [Steroidobacteraceae bacterium]|nr:(2Fe-2S)-binding protein [Steroidobacteraceae bacterium]